MNRLFYNQACNFEDFFNIQMTVEINTSSGNIIFFTLLERVNNFVK